MITLPRQLHSRPSYRSGYARQQSEAKFPELWDGLVGAYCPALGPSGDMLFDLSGYSNHMTGSESGSPALPTWTLQRGIYSIEGKSAVNGMWTGASSQRGQLDFTNGTPFTAAGWAWWDGVGWGNGALLSYVETGFQGWFIWLNGVNFHLYMNGGIRRSLSMSGRPAGWHHLACQWDGERAYTILNGKIRVSSAYSTAPSVEGFSLQFGSYQNGNDPPETGLGVGEYLAEGDIWNRVLTDSELALLAENPGKIFEQRPRTFFVPDTTPPSSSFSHARYRYCESAGEDRTCVSTGI